MLNPIKNKYSAPKQSEFSPKNLVVDIKNGHLYYKSNLGVHRVSGENFVNEAGGLWIDTGLNSIYYTKGNVGIGTINPGEKLEVIGNISASGDISASSLHIKGPGRNEIRGNEGFRLVGAWNVAASAEDLRWLDLEGTKLQFRTNGDAIFEIRSQNGSNNDTYIHFEQGSDPGPRNVSVGVCQDSGSFIIARDEGFVENIDFTITGSNGFIGINEPNPAERLSVKDGNPSGEMVKFFNSSSNSAARVLDMKVGATTPGALNRYINFRKGNDSVVGFISGDGSGGVTFDESSDIRLKKEISPTKYGIGNLLGIEIVEYKYKDSNGFRTGIIAQQAINHFPQAVFDYEEYNIEQGLTPGDEGFEYMTVAYLKYIPLLIKSVQDSHTKILELEEKIKKLENG